MASHADKITFSEVKSRGKVPSEVRTTNHVGTDVTSEEAVGSIAAYVAIYL